ncbi:MAG: type I restriction endonuclease subunit R [Sedimentisphaerales bacterium]
MTTYSEYKLIEKPTMDLMVSLGWETADCFYETFGDSGTLGRDNRGDVVLVSRLKAAIEKLNAPINPQAVEQAIEQITTDRSRLAPAEANRAVYKLIKDGVRVELKNDDGGFTTETVKIIDFDNPQENDFFLASQLWITGELHTRRTDLIGFVNGLPIVFIELKASHQTIKKAYDDNLTDYRDTIPQLFWYNGIVILSNGSDSKISSTTARWEHFNDWKRIEREDEPVRLSLETMIRGTCDKTRLLDFLENFIIYQNTGNGLIKLVAKNHQYIGVNNSIEAVRDIKNRNRQLGVFWHTQGSGKSVSMIFFAQKVLRKLPGNWSFIILTDRRELDGQIYKNFVDSGVVTEDQTQAASCKHLNQLLKEDHRYIFTLIHKFQPTEGWDGEAISKRDDIIVIADEAHRSQYDVLAMNMRKALPNAAFLAFTGTPLMAGEERTREVFGDYISIYDFKQSIEDKATVPLYYENRIPELQLVNDDLNDDMQAIIDNAQLDDRQEDRLQQEFSRQYHLITRKERLETIAADLVRHFTGRGYKGKAMFVAIDKATAVKMYDLVKAEWTVYLNQLQEELKTADFNRQTEIKEIVDYMRSTDMAVVVSDSQNEERRLAEKGLDIKPHRRRMLAESLEKKFKDPDDNFRLVFVCAMWMTGFDVPCCSTIYLDKPMKNHSLMQTIARANRVFGEKVSGLIVDYVGVFRNLQKALAIYGQGRGDGEGGDSPIVDKAELVKQLKIYIEELKNELEEMGIDCKNILTTEGFEKVRLLDDAVDIIVADVDVKKDFLQKAGLIKRIFKAILPDAAATEISAYCILFDVLAKKIRALSNEADISEVMAEVSKLLDDSVDAEEYIIDQDKANIKIDLSQIDFEALKEKFLKGRKHSQAERLQAMLKDKLAAMIELNRTRIDYLEKFQRMIDEYNAGAMNVEEFFKRLVDFAKELKAEEQRAISENLTEEELALFDLLIKPEMKLSKKEEQQVKTAAKDLLEKLKQEKIVLDWKKKQESRAKVRQAIEKILDEELPPVYDRNVFTRKCDIIYQHIYDNYIGPNQSVYAA